MFFFSSSHWKSLSRESPYHEVETILTGFYFTLPTSKGAETAQLFSTPGCSRVALQVRLPARAAAGGKAGE